MKNKLMKMMVTVGMAGLFMAGCGTNSAKEDSYDQLVQEGEIIMGLDDTFAPMGFRDTNGEIVGFDVDLAKEVGERLGVTFNFQTVDWAMKETELNAGNIDVIWNGYTITEEREEKVAFSDPYLDNSQIIIVLEESPIQKKADLAGKTVAAQQTSSAVDAITADDSNIIKDFKNGEVLQYPSNNDVFNDLASGRSDAIVVDETLARYYMKQNADIAYRVLEEDFGKEEYAVGMRKADVKLKKAIDDSLAEMKTDGTYEKIYSKWFAE
ncbi:amino acid ABC transporter substrate-binding protein [Carnobacterium antarcticum]|uniref:Amino acid ABC transporter substrate-binding protein n=1 Tax=Carnobacterium antarcticum TaxID=2126436 RepID=A0ABW4NN49_9LACT|nr:amino acid ABC transporter substrate-binding protein [Carnobacterium sp. CP1]ALV20839.1 Amino acid ABC transporter, amino acid-binding protein [Carnobacterium sp. CP1]